MPLVEDLRDGLKSDWADLKHVAGDRWGGSISAALFLREFVGDSPWVHLDIAGPSYSHRAYGIYPKGGTGHGVLTFLQLVNAYAGGQGPSSAPPAPPAPAPEERAAKAPHDPSKKGASKKDASKKEAAPRKATPKKAAKAAKAPPKAAKKASAAKA
jgi:leucyl aminopeptidase